MRKGYNFIRLGLHGRLMRDGGGEGGATPNGGGDNGGGNSGTEGQSSGESNNNGQEFDATAFWGGSESGDGSAPNGESAQSGTGNESGSSDGASLQAALTERFESMTFGDPVFDAEIAEQINGGDFSGVQERLNLMGRNVVRSATSVAIQIMRPMAEQIMSQMRAEMSETFNSRDDSQALETMFPAAKNPAVRPVIQSIFTQALKNTKGDRTEAVKQTKEMLRFMGSTTADDLDISVAPRGSEDSGRPAQKINWLEELTAR